VLGERSNPLLHQVGREQFGERRGHRLDPRLGLAEGHVRLGRKADPGKDVAFVLHLLSRNAERLTQSNPHLDAAGAGPGTVVIDDSLHPLAANLRIGTVRDDGRVLPRDGALVGQAIGHPALELPRAESALVHQLVERMVGVVRCAERAQCFRKSLGWQRSVEVRDRWWWRSGQSRSAESRRHR
jgi:hypothetical protein